jgi:hypothetical protein
VPAVSRAAVQPGAIATVRLRLPAPTLRRVRAALADGRNVRVQLTLQATSGDRHTEATGRRLLRSRR